MPSKWNRNLADLPELVESDGKENSGEEKQVKKIPKVSKWNKILERTKSTPGSSSGRSSVANPGFYQVSFIIICTYIPFSISSFGVELRVNWTFCAIVINLHMPPTEASKTNNLS